MPDTRVHPIAVPGAVAHPSPSAPWGTAHRTLVAMVAGTSRGGFAGRGGTSRRGSLRGDRPTRQPPIEARRRLREQGIVPIEPDDPVGVMLAPEEMVVAVRRSVTLERRKGWPPEPGGGLGGDLYVTTQRLVHLGRRPVEYRLGESGRPSSRKATPSGSSSVKAAASKNGVEDPCLLRVEDLAAVREAARTSASDASASRCVGSPRRRGPRMHAPGRSSPSPGMPRRRRPTVASVAARGLGPVPHPELVEHAAHVRLHRSGRDRQRRRDVAVSGRRPGGAGRPARAVEALDGRTASRPLRPGGAATRRPRSRAASRREMTSSPVFVAWRDARALQAPRPW